MITEYANKMFTPEKHGDGYEVKVKFNTSMHGHNAGDIVRVKTDKEGTPLNKEMRRRFKDSSIDNCLSFVGEATKTREEIPAKEDKKKKGGK